MLDIKFIRENKDLIAMAAKKKQLSFEVANLIEVDDKRRALLTSIETKRAEQNKVGQTIATTADASQKAQLLSDMKVIKEEMQKQDEELKSVMIDWQKLMLAVPNIPDISVPEGASDKENVEVKTWGEKPQFSFEPKDHITLLEKLGAADFERGAAVSGFRGYFLKGPAARLNFALWQLIADFFTKKGFEVMIVPSLVRREALLGTGYLPQGEEDLYKTQDGEYLAGTGEVATMSYFADMTLEKKDLPKKILAFSPCFRREAGSHSKDTKGLIRVHEFFKFEQVILGEASHEQSVAFHEELTRNAEELLELLKLPYHVVVNCGGDLGLGQVKKYDIEAWVPSQNTYRETHSSSYFHDFQSRRLNIRYKDDDGKLKFVHSLNNTALAFPRILVPLVENYQQEDGSIKVPEVLKSYLGTDILK